MRVLILSQFFYPEMGAPAARFLDFARYFQRHGHEVSILTGFPNFPSGKIHAGYEGKLYMEEEIEGIRVYRTWLHSSPTLGFLNKALGYATFAGSSILAAASKLPDFDAMVATAPPPSIGASALAIAHGKKIPFIYDLRDLWPDAIVNSGRLTNPLLVRSFEALNRATYKKAFALTTVSDGKKEALIEAGVPAQKIEVIPNGVDMKFFDAQAHKNDREVREILQAHGVPENRFIVTYAGIMNPPQGLDILLDSAESIQKSHPNVHFVLVGGGSCRAALEARAAKLPNATLIPEQPRERIPTFLSLSDANAVPLRPRKDSHTVPSKIFEYMASGRPLLLSADGEPQDIVRRSSGGLFSRAGDLDGFLRNLQTMIQSPELRVEAGTNARVFVENHYNRQNLNRRFMHILERAARSMP